eukprot:TRINITY_DN66893_c6_g14_i1.p1 TRINITY_DN66893_c6_g14~~TRINITY_DN66893_c6_g14_i1.p1  ORF type:complete len:667 (+),score=59.30 TRINITY_DN66893_c6_g14_i1:98-2002(+)
MLVAVRARGLTEREIRMTQTRFPEKKEEDYCTVRCQHPNVILSDPDATDSLLIRSDRVYTFDNVFDQHATNEQLYDVTVGPLVDCIMTGYNATCFAYGMTGAGKTYTMMGEEYRVKGLCFLAMDDLFRHILKDDSKYFSIHVSYLEIYNEKIKDLLADCGCPNVHTSHNTVMDNKKDPKNLEIVEDAVRGIVVNGLSDYVVNNLEDVQRLMQAGNRRRTMASTGSNIVSSRSHAILQITVTERSNGIAPGPPHADNYFQKICTGKLSLIDLAGSERASSSDHNKGIRMVEGANINRSLLSLGNCITILANAQQRSDKGHTTTPHIPYRDSKLTRLLKDSLGGNTRTVMIANISPSCITYDETVSTLKYASRARNIRRKIHRNITEDTNISCKEIIMNLKGEIAELREQVVAAQTANQKLQLQNQLPSPHHIGIRGDISNTNNSLHPHQQTTQQPYPIQYNQTQQQGFLRQLHQSHHYDPNQSTGNTNSPAFYHNAGGLITNNVNSGSGQSSGSGVHRGAETIPSIPRTPPNGLKKKKRRKKKQPTTPTNAPKNVLLTEQQRQSLSQISTVASYVNYLTNTATADLPPPSSTPPPTDVGGGVKQELQLCQMYLLCLLTSAAMRRKEEQNAFDLKP